MSPKRGKRSAGRRSVETCSPGSLKPALGAQNTRGPLFRGRGAAKSLCPSSVPPAGATAANTILLG